MESNSYYRTIIDNIPEALFICALTGKIQTVNQKACELLGYTHEEFKRLDFRNLISEISQAEFDNIVELSVKDKHQKTKVELIDNNGINKPAELTLTTIEEHNKELLLITSRENEGLKAEKKLKENEERYRSFFSNSIEAISIFDTETLKFIDVNDAFCAMYGYTKEEALTMSVSDVSAEPENSAKAIKTSVKKGGVDIPIRYHKKKDGTIMIVRISAGPFIWKGRKVMYSILRDITEQLKVEQELIDSKDLLQTMADSVPAYVAVVDAETLRYKFVNQRFVDGYARKREEIIGAHIKDIISEENTKFAMKYINEVRKGNSASYVNIFKIESGERYINVNYTPSFYSNGKVKDIIVLSHDITDIKNAEKQLQKAKEEAEYANQVMSKLMATKNRFFSIIAHDLKSPFNGLIGLSDILINNTVDKQEFKDTVALLHDTAVNGFKLLENLLDWARTQTGEIKYNPEKIILNNIIDYNVNLFKHNANAKNINLSINIKDEIVIDGDIQMINTILRNLVSNAIKFTPKGGSIKIEALAKDDFVNLSVSDSGIGINPAGLQKLFKIDEAYSNPGTEKEKGTGLGLILCKEFVDKHKGSISVESKVSKGTKINVILPLQKIVAIS